MNRRGFVAYIVALVTAVWSFLSRTGDTAAKPDPMAEIKKTCSGRGEFRRAAPADANEMFRMWLLEDMENYHGSVMALVNTMPALKAIWPPGGVFGVNGNMFKFQEDATLTTDLWVIYPYCVDPRQV